MNSSEQIIQNSNPEKQQRWNSILSKVEQITDKLGKPVDEGIKETVAAFIASGFATDGSCEGHLDGGLPYPWIVIDNLSQGLREKLIALNDKAKTKGYDSLQVIPVSDKELYPQFTALRVEAEECKKEVGDRILFLLKDFYSTHVALSPDYVLVAYDSVSTSRIQPTSGMLSGKENRDRFEAKQKAMSLSEKEDYVRNCQVEMRIFTEFLKERFFHN